MRHERGTYYLQEETMERLRAFSERSGIPQSKVVDRLLMQGLEHLERHWPGELPISGAFSNGKAAAGIRKVAKGRRNSQKASMA